ncbi:MAG TPA: outer membrane protein assembly factor BamE [Gammaproteobacteria bacterium]|nr:outer membrane protein assembly factor BamE [Gammaproteobacteria bacterium]
MTPRKPRKTSSLALVTLLASCLLLPACSMYRLPIQQGNALPPNKVSKLSVGMTRKQVSYLLGSPVVRNPFQPDRWVYVYYHSHDGRIERRAVIVHFRNDKVSKIKHEGAKTGG